MGDLHTIIKQCVFVHVGLEKITMERPDLVHIQAQYEPLALVGASHVFIKTTHMNERALLNTIMSDLANLCIEIYRICDGRDFLLKYLY